MNKIKWIINYIIMYFIFLLSVNFLKCGVERRNPANSTKDEI